MISHVPPLSITYLHGEGEHVLSAAGRAASEEWKANTSSLQLRIRILLTAKSISGIV
jgi:hypothetical protein